jgi:hypothetical protein
MANEVPGIVIPATVMKRLPGSIASKRLTWETRETAGGGVTVVGG